MSIEHHVIFAGGGTGGHLYPGLAIARALVRRDPNVRPYFVGARRGIEREVLPQTEFAHLLLDLHPLYRPNVWQNWKTLRGAGSAWIAMNLLGARLRPSLVVGTGGYASGMALAWAFWQRVPIVQHIGDSHPGMTARWFTRMSQEAYLGFPEAEGYLPHGGTTFCVTGNPIEPPPAVRPDRGEAKARWGFPASRRVVLVFGGSQGARAINQAVAAWIDQGLPDDICILWGTGKGQYDGFKHFDGANVRVVPYLSPIRDAYAASDVAFVRGGMMGTSELCAWGLPMVICPLPTAANDHQTANAVALEQAGAAVHLPQRELNATRLDLILRGLLHDPARLTALSAGALARARPHAADEIAQHILRRLEVPVRPPTR